MTQADKKKFRMSSKWKRFRLKIKKEFNAKDAITMLPLKHSWNLHHLCLDTNRYTDLSKQSLFIPLNKDMHKVLHFIYNRMINDPIFLTRLLMYLKSMEVINAKSKA